MAVKRKADEALQGLFGQYASDDEAESGDEDDLDGAGVVLLQRDSDDQGAPTAPTSLLGTIPVPGQFEEGTPQTMDATAGTTGAAPSPGPQQGLDVPELAQLLPPSLLEPPKVPVDPALQAKVKEFLASKRDRGVTLAGALAKHRGYRNPDFLQKMVEHFGIKECGTCFAKELFDPDALPKEDYYDRLMLEQQAVDKRREDARKAANRVDFVSSKGTTPPSSAGPMSAASIVAQAKAAAGKRSKWDTVPAKR